MFFFCSLLACSALLRVASSLSGEAGKQAFNDLGNKPHPLHFKSKEWFRQSPTETLAMIFWTLRSSLFQFASGSRGHSEQAFPIRSMVLMQHIDRSVSKVPSSVEGGISRRQALMTTAAVSALSITRPLLAVELEGPRWLDDLLRSSDIYAVNVDLTRKVSPLAKRLSANRLIYELSLKSKRAIFLGERHPDLRDHLLQSALIRSLHATRKTMAVGLEAVQRRFQPALDDYIAGRINEQELIVATDWQKRWCWPFDAYAPVFRVCRELGVPLLALNVDSEDIIQVEKGGLPALPKNKLQEYVPDNVGFASFGATHAFDEYVSYTLRPPYDMQKRLGILTSITGQKLEQDMTFTNFLSRQALWDEAMASACAGWLAQNPSGLLIGLVGGNHVKFGCGVPARTARMLPGGLEAVTSVLLNPKPFDTFADPSTLRFCDEAVVANEACLQNDNGVENYVLQIQYAAMRGLPNPEGAIPEDQEEATSAMQAKKGSSALALSDYIIFSSRKSSVAAY